MTSRRAFLATLTAALAGGALDPERLLWHPGQKRIFDLWTPPPPVVTTGWTSIAVNARVLVKGDTITLGTLITIALDRA